MLLSLETDNSNLLPLPPPLTLPATLIHSPYLLSTHSPYLLSTHSPFLLSTHSPYMLSTHSPYLLSPYSPYLLFTPHLPRSPFLLATHSPYLLLSHAHPSCFPSTHPTCSSATSLTLAPPLTDYYSPLRYRGLKSSGSV